MPGTKPTAETATRAKSVKPVLAVLAVVAVAFLAYRWWESDERAIRSQLTTIATALTVKADQGELEPLSRIATLGKVLAPDVRISAGGQEIASRDAALALVMRWTPPPGGVTVEFDDLQVKVAADHATADVYCTAKATSRDPRTGEPLIDAREVTVGFAKQDGAWMVTSARTEETLAR